MVSKTFCDVCRKPTEGKEITLSGPIGKEYSLPARWINGVKKGDREYAYKHFCSSKCLKKFVGVL